MAAQALARLGSKFVIHPARVRTLSDRGYPRGELVVYWMQQSQRAWGNHALEYAVDRANETNLPLLVVFGLTDGYPGANLRHYAFMIEGLVETRAALAERGIRMVIMRGDPAEVAVAWSRRARLLVADQGYTRIQKEWRRRVTEHAMCPVVRVESDVVVPVETVSPKLEYAARTIRPKIARLLPEFLAPLHPRETNRSSLAVGVDGDELTGDKESVLERLHIDRSVPPAPGRTGGTSAALARFEDFLEHRLARYAEERNDPNADVLSGMSPYLHFGQVSVTELALRARAVAGSSAEALIEEMIVRRELAMNFTHHCPDYDRFDALPAWARATLAVHETDTRDHIYTPEQFERAETHDPYWNAAQREMVHTGKMHGYMRMYWGKKILEWSPTPRQAFDTAVALNDKYELDGRDPNGYAGVAWCFGLHDRPWAERPVFGTVRFMNDKGLRRKFDADAYARRIDALCVGRLSPG